MPEVCSGVPGSLSHAGDGSVWSNVGAANH